MLSLKCLEAFCRFSASGSLLILIFFRSPLFAYCIFRTYTFRWFWTWFRRGPWKEKRYQNYTGLSLIHFDAISIPLIHFVNNDLKFYSLIKYNVYKSQRPQHSLRIWFLTNTVYYFFAWGKFGTLLYLQKFPYFMEI